MYFRAGISSTKPPTTSLGACVASADKARLREISAHRYKAREAGWQAIRRFQQSLPAWRQMHATRINSTHYHRPDHPQSRHRNRSTRHPRVAHPRDGQPATADPPARASTAHSRQAAFGQTCDRMPVVSHPLESSPLRNDGRRSSRLRRSFDKPPIMANGSVALYHSCVPTSHNALSKA